MPRSRPVGNLWPVLRWALVWAPFALLWSLFTVISFGTSLGEALRVGINAIAWAALLGAGVWYLTGRIVWPDAVRASFYLTHVALALVFSALWLFSSTVTGLLLAGESLQALGRAMAQFLAWRLLTGLWLYGLIAGVGYAVRIRRALVVQERNAAEARALAIQAQLDSLRATVNPHFLFNALHAVSGLIHEDPARADDVIDRVGRLLRRSLDRDGADRIPLREEWEFTEEYLALERLRLGDRLRLSASRDPRTDGCLVPAFTMQTLVENVVLHAIAPVPSGGSVRLEAARRDGFLRLTVTDDGPGLPDTPLPAGHGLDLLRRRLAAYYGGRATLSVSNRPEAGCEAVVTIPFEVAG